MQFFSANYKLVFTASTLNVPEMIEPELFLSTPINYVEK